MNDAEPDLDPTPLVERLVEKTKAHKLNWEPTADRKAFVVSVGGDTTFRITLTTGTDVDMFGQPESIDVPKLVMLDARGSALWEVYPHNLPPGSRGVLQELFDRARRIGNKLDERIGNALRSLETL
jgi:hypothetical protein